MSSYRNNLARLAIGLTSVMAAATAGAVEYSVRPGVDQRVFYDSNLAMFDDGVTDARINSVDRYVTGYELTPRVNLRARTADWQLDFNTRLTFARLSESSYDSDDQLVDLDFTTSGQRSRWDLDATIDRNSTRSAVEEVSVLTATRTERYAFSPRWTRTLNERNSIALGGSYTTLDYSDTPQFSDYDYYLVDATWLRQLTEQNTLQLTVYNQVFESVNDMFMSETDSDTLGLTVGFSRNISESFSTNFSVGARWVDTTNVSRTVCDFISQFFGLCTVGELLESRSENSSNGFTAAAGIDYEGEGWNVSASVSRALVPNGFIGDLLETDEFLVSYGRQLGPTLSFDVRMRLDFESSVDSDAFDRDRQFLEPRIRWRFAERWTLLSSVRFRSRDQSNREADSLAMFFQVQYDHPRTRWSR